MDRHNYKSQIFKLLVLILVLISSTSTTQAQKVGLKTNALYWGTTTPNMGIELALNKKWSIDINAGLNQWTFKHNRKIKHWAALPEVKYWICESFNGSFFGLHGLVTHFNVNDIDIPLGRLKKLNDHRYQGWGYGAGMTYGHQFVLGLNWNLELSLSGGYIYFDYGKYNCATCGRLIAKSTHHYLGMTKATLSLIYVIK